MGVKIVRNDFSKRMKNLNEITTTGGVSGNIKREIMIQWLAENLKRFTAESYADKNGNVTKWKEFKKSTLYRLNKSGNKVFNKRKGSDGSVGLYSESSKLLQKSGWLRLSSSVMGGVKNIQKTGKNYVQIGSAIPHAEHLHKKRPIVSISNSDKSKFERIMVRWLKGEKIK